MKFLYKSIADRESARAKMMGSKERLTFLVEGDGDVTLFEEILTRRDFVVLNWENYKIISELKELKKNWWIQKGDYRRNF